MESLKSFIDYISGNSTLLTLTNILIVTALSVVSFFLTRTILVKFTSVVIKKSKTHWDDFLIKRRFFYKASYFTPVIVIYFYCKYFGFGDFGDFIFNMVDVVIVFITMILITTLIDTVNDIYESYPISRAKPIKGFTQVIKLITILVFTIIIISKIVDKSPQALLTGLGAFAAVIMLVFKDSILGFVAGITLTANNMLHIGDWIVMKSSGADGEVFEISLNTVKVRNWDQTIVTIPTYKLMNDSFTNWRGMQESGGRRIKRSININIHTVHFLNEVEIDRLKQNPLLCDYLNEKLNGIESSEKGSNKAINQKEITNIGVFRIYLLNYLRKNSNIHNEMTMMVRQLQPTEKGLPMEVYCFSKNQEWVKYEGIQADIFDHIMAVLPDFGLKAFQNITEIK